MIRRAAATALVLAACVPVWLSAPWLLGVLGLEALDLLGRVGLVVGFLAVIEAAEARLRSQ